MKIALFGHFGARNFGNESTLIAMLSELRGHMPKAEIRCICTCPEPVTAEYGIPAIPISAILVPRWKINNLLVLAMRKIFIGIPSEIYRWYKAAYALRDTDVLIIVGTGLLNNAFGLAGWGPYSVLKWTAMARLSGCRVCFVSVGVGPLNGRLGRTLAKAALSLAGFRSYRDESSIEYLSTIGFGSPEDRVYPDLAFSLPEEMLSEQDDVDTCHRVVGIGVMSHGGMYGVEPTTVIQYARYKDTLVSFCQWLLVRGYDIRLLIGDLADAPALEEINSRIQQRCPALADGRIFAAPAQSTAELLQQLQGTDFVVATRFHNVLLALALAKPSISISFHSKCSSLMDQMGLAEYCQDIRCLSGDELIAQFCKMEEDAAELKLMIRQKLSENRRFLDEQYRRIWAICQEQRKSLHRSRMWQFRGGKSHESTNVKPHHPPAAHSAGESIDG